MISNIIDMVMPEVKELRNRPLKACYPLIFVDCLYAAVRKDGIARENTIYIILGYDVHGNKDILGIWMSESESKNPCKAKQSALRPCALQTFTVPGWHHQRSRDLKTAFSKLNICDSITYTEFLKHPMLMNSPTMAKQ